MRTVVIGIDPSSQKVAVIYTVDDGPPHAWVSKTKLQDINERCAYFYRRVRAFCRGIAADYPDAEVHVFLEDPVLGRGGARSTIVQSKVNGAIAAAVLNSGVTKKVHQVNNQQWKKRVVGSGNAGKPQIKAWAAQYWKKLHIVADNGKDQDLIDAGGINRHGAAIVGLLERLRKHRLAEARTKPLRRRIRK